MKRSFLLCLLHFFGVAQAKNMPIKKGQKAPGFSLFDENSKKVSLDHYRGKKVALYFYPMDGTPGCTKQACSLRDGYEKLQDKNIVILGISADSVASHQKFKGKKHLPFTLLSDSDQKVAKLYGAARPWLISWIGEKRITVLVDEDGVIVDILKNIDLGDHASQIIEAFKKSNN